MESNLTKEERTLLLGKLYGTDPKKFLEPQAQPYHEIQYVIVTDNDGEL